MSKLAIYYTTAPRQFSSLSEINTSKDIFLILSLRVNHQKLSQQKNVNTFIAPNNQKKIVIFLKKKVIDVGVKGYETFDCLSIFLVIVTQESFILEKREK